MSGESTMAMAGFEDNAECDLGSGCCVVNVALLGHIGDAGDVLGGRPLARWRWWRLGSREIGAGPLCAGEGSLEAPVRPQLNGGGSLGRLCAFPGVAARARRRGRGAARGARAGRGSELRGGV